MKKLTKLMSAILAVMMIVSSIGMIAFAENADVSIKFWNQAVENASGTAQGGLVISNIYKTGANDARNANEGWSLGNKITFNFGTAMDPKTLTPENIKIILKGSTTATTALTGLNELNAARVDVVDNGDGTFTNYLKYQPSEVTSTSYSVNMSDFIEGKIFVEFL